MHEILAPIFSMLILFICAMKSSVKKDLSGCFILLFLLLGSVVFAISGVLLSVLFVGISVLMAFIYRKQLPLAIFFDLKK
jgi:hypothetical protein